MPPVASLRTCPTALLTGHAIPPPCMLALPPQKGQNSDLADQPVLLASLFATLSATVDERKSVRCQAQGHSGVTLTPLGAPSIEVAPQLLVPNTPQRFWRKRHSSHPRSQ